MLLLILQLDSALLPRSGAESWSVLGVPARLVLHTLCAACYGDFNNSVGNLLQSRTHVQQQQIFHCVCVCVCVGAEAAWGGYMSAVSRGGHAHKETLATRFPLLVHVSQSKCCSVCPWPPATDPQESCVMSPPPPPPPPPHLQLFVCRATDFQGIYHVGSALSSAIILVLSQYLCFFVCFPPLSALLTNDSGTSRLLFPCTLEAAQSEVHTHTHTHACMIVQCWPW